MAFVDAQPDGEDVAMVSADAELVPPSSSSVLAMVPAGASPVTGGSSSCTTIAPWVRRRATRDLALRAALRDLVPLRERETMPRDQLKEKELISH